ncbi:MAG: type II secretion system protein [Deltaproteobacteria bacterium]
MRGVRQPRGFTLIEVLIVVAVIGVMALAAAPAVNSLTGANARSAAGEIAGAYRYLFDTAALRHQTCRMVLDMDAREWWAECTTGTGSGRRGQPVMGKDGVAEDDERGLARGFSDEPDAEKRKFLARAKFAEFRDRQVQKRRLRGGAAFEKVWTPRQRDPQTKGKAYVYFYPQGQADRVQIPVADGTNAYTVVTQPLTGRARVVTGIPEAPR